MRGSSHSEAKEAKVVTLTRCRLCFSRICRTPASSLASQGSTVRSRICASCVISTWRVPRTSSGVPSSSSRLLICRLMADWVTNSSSAASLKLRRRATASKARRLVSESGRRRPVFISNPHQ